MVRLQLGLEFRGRINSRINLSAEGFLGDCQRRDGIAEAHVTHHHQSTSLPVFCLNLATEP